MLWTHALQRSRPHGAVILKGGSPTWYKNLPYAILFTDVIRPSPKALFPTNRQSSSIHEITEEFPTSGNLIKRTMYCELNCYELLLTSTRKSEKQKPQKKEASIFQRHDQVHHLLA